jgi:uncharacterized membrane protein
MKNENTFWIVVGLVSVVVAGACVTVALMTNNAKVMWGLLLMPILWSSVNRSSENDDDEDDD